MAYRPILKRQNVLAIAVGAAAATSVFYPLKPIYAESPEAAEADISMRLRKPIYDDLTPADPSNTNTSSSSSSQRGQTHEDGQNISSADSTSERKPTPTDRLAVHVRTVRLAVYRAASRAEEAINTGLSEALHLENNVAQTIASLAPPKTANEALMPGLVYVLVAALAGSIVTRRRGIVLRLAVPVTFAVGMGHAVIPVTTANVGNLIWQYEKRYPPLANAHLAIRERTQQIWETGKSHSAMTVEMANEKVGEARKGVENWVKEGN